MLFKPAKIKNEVGWTFLNNNKPNINVFFNFINNVLKKSFSFAYFIIWWNMLCCFTSPSSRGEWVLYKIIYNDSLPDLHHFFPTPSPRSKKHTTPSFFSIIYMVTTPKLSHTLDIFVFCLTPVINDLIFKQFHGFMLLDKNIFYKVTS